MEIIEKIEEIENYHPTFLKSNRLYDGYIIETNKRKIYCLIESDQHCCETWGYLWTNEDTKDFIGVQLYNIEIVDGDFDKLNIDKDFLKDCDKYNYTYCVFIDFNTSNGLFQLVAYNNHNGYYGHNVLIYAEKNNDKNKTIYRGTI